MCNCSTGNVDRGLAAGAQQEILKGLLGDPKEQLEATRLVLVKSLGDFLGGPAFPPPTPNGAILGGRV